MFVGLTSWIVTAVLDIDPSLGGVNDPKLHLLPLVTAKDALEVDHRERTALDDQNRTVCRSIPVNATAKNVVAQGRPRFGGREVSGGEACPNRCAGLTEREIRT